MVGCKCSSQSKWSVSQRVSTVAEVVVALACRRRRCRDGFVGLDQTVGDTGIRSTKKVHRQSV